MENPVKWHLSSMIVSPRARNYLGNFLFHQLCLRWELGDKKIDEVDESFLARKVSQKKSWTTQSSKMTYKNAFVIFLNWCGAVGYCEKEEWKIITEN